MGHFRRQKRGVEGSDNVGVPTVDRLVAGGRGRGRVQSIHGEVRSGQVGRGRLGWTRSAHLGSTPIHC